MGAAPTARAAPCRDGCPIRPGPRDAAFLDPWLSASPTPSATAASASPDGDGASLGERCVSAEGVEKLRTGHAIGMPGRER